MSYGAILNLASHCSAELRAQNRSQFHLIGAVYLKTEEGGMLSYVTIVNDTFNPDAWVENCGGNHRIVSLEDVLSHGNSVVYLAYTAHARYAACRHTDTVLTAVHELLQA